MGDSHAHLRLLWDELDEAYKAASTAMAADDMQTWGEHASRGAEIHEEIARRLGWREKPASQRAPGNSEEPSKHGGGNAEDCPACDTSTMPYPWICPESTSTETDS